VITKAIDLKKFMSYIVIIDIYYHK
jgi:hypothetical protein